MNDEPLSRRDYLAGMAMQGMIASPKALENLIESASHDDMPLSKKIAKVALKQADALIYELDRI